MPAELAIGFRRKAVAESLMDYLKGKEVIGFESRPVYSRDGDFITLFLKDDDYYAERVDELLTVFHSTQTDELVGCKIKGVQLLLETLGRFGVSVEDGEVQINFLFVAGALISPSKKDQYESLGKRTSAHRMPRCELQPA